MRTIHTLFSCRILIYFGLTALVANVSVSSANSIGKPYRASNGLYYVLLEGQTTHCVHRDGQWYFNYSGPPVPCYANAPRAAYSTSPTVTRSESQSLPPLNGQLINQLSGNDPTRRASVQKCYVIPDSIRGKSAQWYYDNAKWIQTNVVGSVYNGHKVPGTFASCMYNATGVNATGPTVGSADLLNSYNARLYPQIYNLPQYGSQAYENSGGYGVAR